MKIKPVSILSGALLALVLTGGYFLWSDYYRARVEQQAYDLMTTATQAVLGNSDWTPVMENMDPLSPVQVQDMSSLPNFGRLVQLGDLEGVAEVPSLFSGEAATAQLRIVGHFTNGSTMTEAILVRREGLWLFSHFGYIPGAFAQ